MTDKIAPPIKGTFSEIHPDLVGFWSGRNELSPDDVGAASTVVVWWEVPGLEPFERSVNWVHRRGYAAPKGLVRPRVSITDDPVLSAEYSSDNALPPEFVGRGSKDTSIIWECRECATTWTGSPAARHKGNSPCPSCLTPQRRERDAHRARVREEKALIRERRKELRHLRFRLRKARTKLDAETRRRDNAAAAEARRIARLREEKSSLADVAPEVAAEIVGVDPTTVSAKSGVKQTWQGGECGHTWQATPHDRVGKGSGCPACAGREIVAGDNDMFTLFPEIADEWSVRNDIAVALVSPGSNIPRWWQCAKCGHEWKTQPNYRCYQGYGCPRCFSTGGTSRSEVEMADYIASLVGEGDVVRGSKSVIPGGYQVDVYVPSRAIGFEFNGLYWHSDVYLDRKYHLNKTRAAEEVGVRLVHIWEDDWKYRGDVVRSMIRALLGANDRPRVGARECEVVWFPSVREVAGFFEDTHLLGAPRVAGTVIGLVKDGEIVAAMTARRNSGAMEITRYATSCRVPGGFTRLLSRLEEVCRREGLTEIATFSDNAVSRGDLYRASGFVPVREVAPDYMYARPHGRRSHKFNFRIAKFRSNPNLKWEPGLTERELAELNGLLRIYDAGKVKWVKEAV